MKYFRCERGLAMLEAALATAVFGILISIALPTIGRSLDVSYVDYEIRCLHSMFHYTKSVSRLSKYEDFGVGVPPGYNRNAIELRLFTDANPNYYCVRKQDNTNPIRIKEDHLLERKFTLSLSDDYNPIVFGVHGDLSPANSFTISLKKDNIGRNLVVTQYGRARIDNL